MARGLAPRAFLFYIDRMKLSTAAKNPYRGGSRRMYNNCGKRSCPGNVAILKMLYYERNKEAVKARAISRPKSEIQIYRKNWKVKNRHIVAANTAQRKKHIRVATPKWLTKEQREEIRSFYKEAEILKSTTGVDYEVDHIVPVRGGSVCGLHVPWNLRVITADENQKKNRKLLDI